MATTAKLLATGSAPNAQGALTIVNGANNVPTGKHWIAKVVVYNSGAASRTVTCGWHSSNAALVVGDYLINAEALASKERREFGIRIIPSGYYFRASQGTADADVQVEIIGYEEDN